MQRLIMGRTKRNWIALANSWILPRNNAARNFRVTAASEPRNRLSEKHYGRDLLRHVLCFPARSIVISIWQWQFHAPAAWPVLPFRLGSSLPPCRKSQSDKRR